MRCTNTRHASQIDKPCPFESSPSAQRTYSILPPMKVLVLENFIVKLLLKILRSTYTFSKWIPC